MKNMKIHEKALKSKLIQGVIDQKCCE